MVTVLSFLFGYLTEKQREIWHMLVNKLKQSDIARKMRVSRQTINKNINVIERKISQALYEAARINKVDIRIIKPLTGILVGYSRTLNTEVVIYLSVKHGLQVWYKHKGDCNNCEFHEECKRILLDEFEIRKIPISEREKTLEPSQLAEILFSHLLKDS